ncbi:5-carboxymethyl-2-hydroxymuconate Delta-isomerase [Aquibium oceanicum]|uniref:5-carboxymethyl-2-hydroxymuconate isomerase n=1 Tax=Aquibium oceanicum TaxID=1670800 RepID=A0A1L3SLP1_9HYPH|nr:5-carboxymethyl-2-hydroxymuconate Delta-isomerase [Aquibium oceanicum]APH70265.1 5-carboxymethyl-2-hydroxymuconate isomerase [Aquibium oceanicum]
MPHFTMEYSANLDGKVDVGGLCQVIHGKMLETGLFEEGAIRVRAIRCEAYAIADKLPQNAFIDMSLRIGVGRSEAEKKGAGDGIFEAATTYLNDLLAEPYFALSLEIREIDRDLSWKRNSMHSRLRKYP